MKFAVGVAIALILAWILSPDSPVTHGPGQVAPDVPVQVELSPRISDHNGFQIETVAQFNVTARILGKETYRFDEESALSPVDLALGWGPMSDETVLAELDISQSGRFYRWRTSEMPIPRAQIERNSANMHIIPQERWVERAIDDARVGDVIELRGMLVDATGPNGWRWRTSRTRNDTGAGACELFLVTDARVLDFPSG